MGDASSHPSDAFPVRLCLAFPIEELRAVAAVLRMVLLAEMTDAGLSGAAKIYTALQRHDAHEIQEELARRGTTGASAPSLTAGAGAGRL